MISHIDHKGSPGNLSQVITYLILLDAQYGLYLIESCVIGTFRSLTIHGRESYEKKKSGSFYPTRKLLKHFQNIIVITFSF